jgi:hypothetical protein
LSAVSNEVEEAERDSRGGREGMGEGGLVNWGSSDWGLNWFVGQQRHGYGLVGWGGGAVEDCRCLRRGFVDSGNMHFCCSRVSYGISNGEYLVCSSGIVFGKDGSRC